MGSSVICGLTADKMKKEAHLFTAKLEGIMKKEKIGHNCAILKLTGNLSLQSYIRKCKIHKQYTCIIRFLWFVLSKTCKFVRLYYGMPLLLSSIYRQWFF